MPLDTVGELVSKLLFQWQGKKRTSADVKHIEALLASCPKLEIGGELYIRQDELRGLLHNFQQAVKHQDYYLFEQPRGLNTDRVVGIEEFVESRYYLGLKSVIRPAVKKCLLEFFESGHYYVTAVCTGALGTGKTFFAIGGQCYLLYLMSLLRNPQVEFHFPVGQSLYYIIQSLNATVAKRAVYNEMRERIQTSPYFQENFPFDKKVEGEMRFPNNIYVSVYGGNDTACLSLNVVGAIVDEVNKMLVTEDSVKNRFTGDQVFDQAERINKAIERRMKNRFQRLGRLPGKMFLMGSTEHPDDFTNRKLREAETDPTIYPMKMSVWESLGPEPFSGKTFRVEIGSDYHRTQVLDDDEEPYVEENVRSIPIEFLSDFQKDPDGALREHGGEASSGKHRFIPLALIDQAVEAYNTLYDGKGIFFQEEISIGLGEKRTLEFEEIVDLEFIKEYNLSSTLSPYYKEDVPLVPFAVGLDIGTSKDAFGLGISCITGYLTGRPFQVYDDKAKGFKEVSDIQMPIVTNFGPLRITRGRGSEVDLERVKQLIFWIKRVLNLKWFTSDSHQHVMMLQAFKKAGFRAGTISVDADIGPFLELASALKDGRYLCRSNKDPDGNYTIHTIARELKELEREGDVIDHPRGAGASKDVADPAAASYYILLRKEAIVRQTRSQIRNMTSQRVSQQIAGTQSRRRLRLR